MTDYGADFFGAKPAPAPSGPDYGQQFFEPATGTEQPIREFAAGNPNWTQRARAAMNLTDEGRVQSIRDMGYEARQTSGGLFYRKPGTNEWRPWDGPGWEGMADVADLAGVGVEAAPSVIGGALAGPVGAIGGAMVGNVGRQALSADEMGAFERVKEVGKAGLYAGAAEGVGAGVAGLIRGAGPQRQIGRVMDRRAMTPKGARGRQAEEFMQVGLTPAQRADDQGLRSLEAVVKNLPSTAGRADDLYQKQMTEGLRKLQREINKATGIPLTPGGMRFKYRGFGDHVGAVDDAFQKSVAQIRNSRRRAWDTNMQMAEDIVGKNERIFDVTPVVKEMRSIMAEGQAPGLGPINEPLYKQIKSIADELEKSGGQLSVSEMNRYLSRWGKIARSGGSLGQDIERAEARMVGGRVMGSLNKVLDEFLKANEETPLEGVVNHVRAARDAWKSHSEALGELESSVVGRMFGKDAAKSPEELARSIARMDQSHVRATVRLLENADPGIAQRVKGIMLEDAMIKAGAPKTEAMPTEIAYEFSPRKFVTAMRQSGAWEAMTPKERTDFGLMVSWFDRVARQGMDVGSRTAPMEMAKNVVSVMAMGIPSPGMIRDVAMSAIGAKKIASLMEDSVARRAAFTLAKEPSVGGKISERGLKAAAFLAERWGLSGGVEPASPTSTAPTQ